MFTNFQLFKSKEISEHFPILCNLAPVRRNAGVVERGRLEICCSAYAGPGVRIPLSPQIKKPCCEATRLFDLQGLPSRDHVSNPSQSSWLGNFKNTKMAGAQPWQLNQMQGGS